MNLSRWSHSLCIPTHSYLSVSPSSHPSLFSPPLSVCLTSLVLSGVCLVDLIVEPHVSHGHAVLGQCARLVRADGGGGAESFDGFQVLYQTVLLGHSLGSESQAHLGGQWEVWGGVQGCMMIVSRRWASAYASMRSSVCAGETKHALQSVQVRVCVRLWLAG